MSDPRNDAERASGMLCRIEDLEAKRTGRTVQTIRKDVARQLRSSTGTLANIRRLRRQTIPAWLMTALERLLIDTLQAERTRLEHEIVLASRTGVGNREDAFVAAAASLTAAKTLLRGAARKR